MLLALGGRVSPRSLEETWRSSDEIVGIVEVLLSVSSQSLPLLTPGGTPPDGWGERRAHTVVIVESFYLKLHSFSLQAKAKVYFKLFPE